MPITQSSKVPTTGVQAVSRVKSGNHLPQEPMKLTHIFPKAGHWTPTPNIQLITHTPWCLQNNYQKHTPFLWRFLPQSYQLFNWQQVNNFKLPVKVKSRVLDMYSSSSKEKASLSPLGQTHGRRASWGIRRKAFVTGSISWREEGRQQLIFFNNYYVLHTIPTASQILTHLILSITWWGRQNS